MMIIKSILFKWCKKFSTLFAFLFVVLITIISSCHPYFYSFHFVCVLFLFKITTTKQQRWQFAFIKYTGHTHTHTHTHTYIWFECSLTKQMMFGPKKKSSKSKHRILKLFFLSKQNKTKTEKTFSATNKKQQQTGNVIKFNLILWCLFFI